MLSTKICGITRSEDALLAVDLGASMLGFVFWPSSPRFIDPYKASSIVNLLPSWVSPVGVFVDQPADYIREVADIVKLGTIQLHGNEEEALLNNLPYRVIKAVRIFGTTSIESIKQLPLHVTVLLDAYDPVRIGGTGKIVDWAVASKVSRSRKVILSGGLRTENVVQAIETVNPIGVDVSSGVEECPGVKDPNKMRKFFQAVQRAKS